MSDSDRQSLRPAVRWLSIFAAAALVVSFGAGCGLRHRRSGLAIMQTIAQPPRLLSQAAPQYPPRAREQGLEGDVVVAMLVDTAGSVASVDIVSGPFVFRDAARTAALSSVFQAARIDTVPVPYRVVQRFSFRLEAGRAAVTPRPLWEVAVKPFLLPSEAPSLAVAREAYGDILVEIVVGAEGDVTNVRLLTGTLTAFEPAREMLSAMRYRPARDSDRAVSVLLVALVTVRASGLGVDVRNRDAPLYDGWKVDEQPVLLEEPPREALPSGRGLPSGEVYVGMIVDTTGGVEVAWLVRGPVELRKEILDATRRFRFLPARHEGRPVRVWTVRRLEIARPDEAG